MTTVVSMTYDLVGCGDIRIISTGVSKKYVRIVKDMLKLPRQNSSGKTYTKEWTIYPP